MATIADMTLEDLRKFVQETLDERLGRLLGTFELSAQEDEDVLTWDDIRSMADQNRWTPPVKAKSSLDFLREDRGR
ncbi:MAG: hypothetical protein SF029_19460 [bacterium]|nr:hypothetical protein [bacterium]